VPVMAANVRLPSESASKSVVVSSAVIVDDAAGVLLLLSSDDAHVNVQHMRRLWACSAAISPRETAIIAMS